jgi:hypothetical protein
LIVSVHLADVGRLRVQRMLFRPVDAAQVTGMTYAETVFAADLGNRLPLPHPGRVGLIACWEDDAALDRFLAGHHFAKHLANGWHVRLEPLHRFGSWAGMNEMPMSDSPAADDEPVVALTLGRLRRLRTRAFLKAARPTERDAVENPAVAAVTGFGRLARPGLVATFTIWRSLAAMREYAFSPNGSHQAAVKVDRAKPFHSESAFIRFRPYASHGLWDGRDPVADVRQVNADPV